MFESDDLIKAYLAHDRTEGVAISVVSEDRNTVIDLVCGTLTFVTFTFIGARQPQVIKIGSREIAVLRYLVSRNGYLVSKDEILNNVWSDKVVCENTVSVALSNIRKLLRRIDQDCRCLVTVARKGYIFYPHRSGLTIEYAKGRDV